jgi:hypothetical protein
VLHLLQVDAHHPQSIWTPTTEDAVIASAEQEPSRSSSDIARELVSPLALVFNVLMKMMYTHTTIHRINIIFQEIVLYGHISANGCIISALPMCPMKTFFVLIERVFA